MKMFNSVNPETVKKKRNIWLGKSPTRHGRAESAVLQRKTLGFIYTNETFYGVQFLNKSVKLFEIFHQLFQSAKKRFSQLFNNLDKICKKKYFID